MNRLRKLLGLKKKTMSKSKLELDATQMAYGIGDKPFSAIVEVSQPDYVPTCVRLRERVSSRMFTALITPPALQELERDPRVISISPGKLVGVG